MNQAVITMKNKGFTTKIVHGDRESPIEHGSVHKPVHHVVLYGYDTTEELAAVFQNKQPGYSYGRQNNPTTTALQAKISALETGVDTLCFATGMAAITATCLTLLKAGDHLVSSQFLFGNTNSLFQTLTQFGIEVTFVDATDVANVEAAVQPNTRMVFVETIANPCTQVADLKAIGDFCRRQDLVYVVDNTMTSPALFLPKAVGAGLSINSLSKCIAGHGEVLGGAVTDLGEYDWSRYPNINPAYRTGDPQKWGLQQIRKKGLRDMGATLAPDSAHRIAIGSETLALRMDKACSNAQALAEYFSRHKAIKQVYYPGLAAHPQHQRAQELFNGFGALMSIDLVDNDACFDVLNKLQGVVLSSHLGDNRTLAIPVAHTIFFEMGPERRASMGISDGTIRLSVGIEDRDDLLEDFERALG
ncbi:cystathionine gamma-synthase family protein [Halomonas stenophila]|uniref:O-acetylhomoserine (Thiol)-lyase n=1 Tax=Halomonas stenophila TaxID=795312 RepID=A0A7W5EW68_9GAMM|nr:cystathionine gamma-synthase family protein [Halomonas stenophila]MBB3232559.1 O-acetylhomoserine (thiol)-lyase [Halomonas stenophila]